MKIRVFAVVCANGHIHEGGAGLEVYETKPRATREASEWDRYIETLDGKYPGQAPKCGPHRAITLAGEVSRL